ncbi:MAG: DUF456 domain-containing protein [Bacteroidales bacterium]|jgi:uncharacterized protein|nr:DUF456 domain-containing protein [Bacteroidales bacterium]
MGTLLLILAIFAGLVGIIGSIVPALPGPPISWVGILLMYLRHNMGLGSDKMTTTLLFVMLALTIVVTVLDYVVPAYFTRKTGGSKAAAWGSIAGLFVGMFFFPPWGVIIGAFAGAFIAEIIIENKESKEALRAAWGAFLGFIFGTGLKLTCSAVMLYYIIVSI